MAKLVVHDAAIGRCASKRLSGQFGNEPDDLVRAMLI
jgi:hypothetical protein